MNKIMIKSVAILTVILILIPAFAVSQEKKVHVKKVMEVDGTKEVFDTVFVVKDGENSEDLIKKFTWKSTSDSAKTYAFDVVVESDGEGDDETNIVIVADGESYTVNSNGNKNHKVKVIKLNGNEKDVIFFDDFDIDIDKECFDEIRVNLERMGDELDDIKIEIDGEKLLLLEELDGLKELKKIEIIKEMEDLHKLKDLKHIEMSIPDLNEHSHNSWMFYDHHSNRVSEKELREAGIKVKADRLNIDDYNININNGVLDISFTIAGDSSPKVEIYNFYGDKVFSGKPVLMNGKYEIKIDLSKKQHGTYYLQIINKSSSSVKKFKL